MSSEKQDRSIWISPVNPSLLNCPDKFRKFFMKDFECGLITDIRVRQGPKIPKKAASNLYAIIEYSDANSVHRSLRIAYKKKSVIDGQRFRIYKAGTRTIVFWRPANKRRM